MRKLLGTVGVWLLLLGSSLAHAELKAGWVTFISLDGKQLMLNSEDLYVIGCNCLQNVKINDHVQVIWELRGQQKVITAIDKMKD